MLVKRSTWATLVTGMMPGTMGMVIPAARARSTKDQYRSQSKKSWVVRNDAPRSCFIRAKRRSSSAEVASGWASG